MDENIATRQMLEALHKAEIKSLTAERDEYKAALRDLWEWIQETGGDLDRECFLDAVTKTQWSALDFPSFKGYPEHREAVERATKDE